MRAVLFDFNGLLVDDEPIHFRLFQKVLAEEGIEMSREEYYENYLGFDDEGCFSAVLAAREREATPGLLARWIARKSAYYQATIRQEGYPFFPGAVELVRGLHERGVALGVVSGALEGEVRGALAQEGLSDAFKLLVAAEHVAASKPDPEGYLKGLQGLNTLPPLPGRLLHPHEVLAVEDSLEGLASARAAGLVTVGVAQTYSVGELEASGLADRVVEKVGDLTVDEIVRLESV
jgi:HAD superfamily hydrolase (TIGR01509 family)